MVFISVLQASKDCPFKIAKGLTTPTGNVTWHLSDGIPDSTVYVRAYLMSPPAEDGTMTYLAYGNSKGYIQVRNAAGALNLALLCLLSRTSDQNVGGVSTCAEDWVH